MRKARGQIRTATNRDIKDHMAARPRWIIILLLLPLMAASCHLARRGSTKTRSGTAKYGSATEESPSPKAGAAAAQQSGGSSRTSSKKSSSKSGGTTTGSTGNISGSAKPPAISDFGSTGSAARGLLMPSPYTEIVVEIDYVSGRAPSQQVQNNFVDRLEEVAQKNIKLSAREIPARNSDASGYTESDVLSIANGRRFRSTGSQAAIYIVYLNGQRRGDPNPPNPEGVIGAAVAGTVIVVFPDKLNLVALPDFQKENLRTAVIVHEIGHILSLVNIGYTSPRGGDHVDPSARGCGGGSPCHSNNRDSVMYWALESTGVATQFVGRDIPTRYDANDLADLADRRAGKY
jgi:hypothetical protein